MEGYALPCARELPIYRFSVGSSKAHLKEEGRLPYCLLRTSDNKESAQNIIELLGPD